MNDLERFLRDRNADADTWIDDEGMHVHDWDTDRCLLFDANEKDFHFICIYIHAMRKICIENDVYRKAYRDWAEEFVHFEKDEDLQFLLVDNYHCLDILNCSENKEVRRAVIEQNIKYAFEDHIFDYDQDIIVEILMREIKPHAELLDTFLEYNDGSWDSQLLCALDLKQKARNIIPTTIEKTMSPLQLFETDNPLWTTIFTGYQVYNIIQNPSPRDALLKQKELNEKN